VHTKTTFQHINTFKHNTEADIFQEESELPYEHTKCIKKFDERVVA